MPQEGELIRVGALVWDDRQVMLVLAGAAVALLLILVAAVVMLLMRKGQRAGALATELAELKGRIQSISETFVQGQSQLALQVDQKLDGVTRQVDQKLDGVTSRVDQKLEGVTLRVDEKLDGVTHRLGQDLSETSRVTGENLARLGERLAVIDHAQQKIGELSSSLFSLQTVLSDKQQRGAFGQGRMEAIVQDALPSGTYFFQPTLSNGRRPDCLIQIPHSPALVIDAKFPLEGFEALRRASAADERKAASQQLRHDVARHIDDIAGKYRIEGETQNQALMFVPSESIYLDLHESFPELLQKASREGVMIVSPTLLMLAVQTMVGILKDVRMREQADQIQKEVATILRDVESLGERVLKLQSAFRKLNQEFESVVAGAQRITERGKRIGMVELKGGDAE